MYRGRSREDTKPHIFAIADEAFRNLVDEGQNQSILVTGESGAGKTENTKKVIQYLAAVATTDTPRAAKSGQKHLSSLSEQILRANPILESFGNAQTVRNNNSSRFGKFIRIEFMRSGQIAGAYIDWYLLEKSRVVKLSSMERNYHIFYQLLRGADTRMKKEWRLADKDIEDFQYTRQGNDTISGVSDFEEWNSLIEAFHVMGFSDKEQSSILKTVAIVLHLGNISVMKESIRADQAAFEFDAMKRAELVARLLGIPSEPFINGLLHPKVKAGREWVEKAQTPEQVRLSIDALAKGIYERQFGDLVTRINRQLNRAGGAGDDSNFIGVLDIAGFEIFEENSFEQLCINFTNEKLQQFFNHHMFVLEQEEYAREQIEWKFIDFGKDLQPTIDLIELSNPIGIFSCLDEDCVMPKATDVTFTEKLHQLWDRKTPKYRRSLRSNGFVLTHYAAEVEYSTNGWLEKNKDPLNDNVTRLLSDSTDKHIAYLFADCAETEDDPGSTRSRVKKGLFRTVAQRHKEQLSTLMGQLHSTHPHFVRCIIPNHKKKAKQFNAPLVLDQLRCNGVLEGIRIARTGFPNRLSFTEFRQRYEVLCNNMPKTYLEGQVAVKIMLEQLAMDTSFYRVGLTKVFFRAGVLADLEERRDKLISDIMTRFQAVARGFVQRRIANKRLYRAEATRIIQRNFQVNLDLQANPWWRLFVRMKPLLGASRQAAEVKRRDETIAKMQEKMESESQEKQKLDEERRRAENEIQRIQHTLESERALALDKEEIFKRLQNREAQLSEELASVLEDQEKLEDELDAVILEQKKAEEEAQTWRKELEQASALIAKLESDKQGFVDQISRLDEELKELEVAKSRRSEEEEALSQEVKMLQSHLSLKDRKLQELESKLLKSNQDVDIKLVSSSKELNAAKKQVRDLQDENKLVRQQMSELSNASTSFEDIIRQKESELAILKVDIRKHESDRQAFESERRSLTTKHDSIRGLLRDLQTELETIKIQKSQADRDAADAKRLLEQRISDDEGRKVLERQVEDLRKQLLTVQTDLTRERQSRDDVQMLGDHKYNELKRNFDSLNESKITIEKELYSQQDVLRRATETRSATENERKEYQSELRRLREQFIELQEAKLEAETDAENRIIRAATERQAALKRELDSKDKQLTELGAENSRLSEEVNGMMREMADADIFHSHHDQEKERLSREVITLRGRLSASENDNRALLNKVQQKNLDIARSNSRAGEAQRGRTLQLANEKTKLEEENKRLHRQLEEAQLSVSSLEKQKEKLSLNMEDLTHEVNREHKTSRNAEKLSSTANLQLADANRKLETERQLRTQAQSNTRTVQTSLDQANSELAECRNQLMLLRKVFDPNTSSASITYEAAKPSIAKAVDLAQRLETSQQTLRVANDKCSMMESQLQTLRDRHGEELAEMESRYADSKRALLDEMSNTQVNARSSPLPYRGVGGENRKPFSPTTTPRGQQRQISDATNDSARSDRTIDTVAYNNRMDLQAELELTQNKLDMSEMRNRHLQTQLDRSPSKSWEEDSPSVRRMQKLERENHRLHDRLDDSSKQVSVLERSLHTGQLTLKEVQTKSHEELCDFINSQQRDQSSLNHAYNVALNELSDAKSAFEELKTSKAQIESELRNATSRFSEVEQEHEHDVANHSQLLQEFSDLQIRLDSETSKAEDLTASLELYKARSQAYFTQLEQAEMAVLKATKAEEFAKSRAKETDEYCAQIMAERKSLDTTIEDLQRQTQKYEERIEDLSADLEGALQAKRRLQNELEDYRSQRATAIEDKEISFEQTRKKYQTELSTLNNELEVEREHVIHEREENGRLRDEIEELRGKWDDEVLNSTSWSKEKKRLDFINQELIASRDEAVSAHNDAQSRAVTLLSQNRELRDNVMRLETERDTATKERKNVEQRLAETLGRMDELARGSSPSVRNAAATDREILELKANLAQQQDINEAALGKMRRADSLAAEAQNELQAQREANVELLKEKAALEKTTKDAQLKLVDLETKSYSTASQDVKFLHGRIQEVGFHKTRDSKSFEISSANKSFSLSAPSMLQRTRVRPKHVVPVQMTAPFETFRGKLIDARNLTQPSRKISPGNARRAPLFCKQFKTYRRQNRKTSLRLDGRIANSERKRRKCFAWNAS
jgi:myosin heavy chain 9/10/11/14